MPVDGLFISSIMRLRSESSLSSSVPPLNEAGLTTLRSELIGVVITHTVSGAAFPASPLVYAVALIVAVVSPVPIDVVISVLNLIGFLPAVEHTVPTGMTSVLSAGAGKENSSVPLAKVAFFLFSPLISA